MRKPAEPTVRGVFSTGMNDAAVERAFKTIAELIRHGWMWRIHRKRRGIDTALHRESPEDWMVRTTYRVVRAMLIKGYGCAFTGMIERLDHPKLRYRGQHSIAGQPFKEALLLLFGHNAPTVKPLMSRTRRHELGDAMQYAYLHRVHSRYVVGFIKQVGQKQARARMLAKHTEPGFKSRRMKNPPHFR